MNLLKLQDQLKGMPDAYLTQMVQQPDGQIPQFLVLGELQRRKDMRDAAQQAPQSTVAEDVVQEGLGALQPQQAPVEEESEQIDQGIAAIPTQMEEAPAMAGGGIIAFDKGGDVPSMLMTGQEESKKSLWEQLKAKYKAGEISKAVLDNFINANRALIDIATYKPFAGGYVPTAADKAAPIPVAPTTSPAPATSALPGFDEFVQTQSAAPVSVAPRSSLTPAAPKGSAVQGLGLGSLKWTDLAFPEAEYAKLERPTPSAEEETARFKAAMGEDEGIASLKEKLAKMEERAKGEEERAPWMALVRAGLATAAGTSPFALTNIGAGGLEGLKDYQATRDRLERNEEKRFDIQSRMSQAERAEKLAAVKFGEDSAQAKQARADQVQLAKLNKQLDIQSTNLKGKLDVQKANIDNLLEGRKLDVQQEYYRGMLNKPPAEVQLMEWLSDPKNRAIYQATVGATKTGAMTEKDILDSYDKAGGYIGTGMSIQQYKQQLLGTGTTDYTSKYGLTPRSK